MWALKTNMNGPPLQCGSCRKFFRTNYTFSSHLEKCEGNKKEYAQESENASESSYIEGNLEEEFSEEYLLGEEFDLGERSELDLLRMKEEFVPIKKETDEFETKIENAEVEMFDDKLLLPNDLAKELIHVKEESVTINATNISQICKVERNQEIVEGDIAGERVKKEGTEGHQYIETHVDEFQENEQLDDEEKCISSLEVKSGTYSKSEAKQLQVESSMESIEIIDSDEEKNNKRLDESIDLTSESGVEQPQNILDVKKPTKRKKKGRAPLEPKPCYYCVEECHDRIELAKHMISNHWKTVYEAHGGGRKPNNTYYQIEDSRVLRPKPPPMSARTSFHMKGLAGAEAVNKAYQANRMGNFAFQSKNPAWQKLAIAKYMAQKRLSGSQNQIGMKNQIGMHSPTTGMVNQIGMQSRMGIQNRKSNQQLQNYTKYIKQPASINKMNKNPHNPSWFRKTPARNGLPMQRPGEVFDLTADDEEERRCKVCEDDFNWPDEKHDCPLKSNKKTKLDVTKNNSVDLKKGGLTLLKEKLLNKSIPESVKNNEKGPEVKVVNREQLEASLKKIPKSTMLVPLRNSSTGILSDKNFSPRPPPARVQPSETLPARKVSDSVSVMSSRRVKSY